MTGKRTVMQEALFYGFSLENHVPPDHMLRSIDRFVDLSGVREHLRPYYSETGRPSIDPELMIRCLSSATASVSDRNGDCVKRCILTLPIAGSTNSTFSKNRQRSIPGAHLNSSTFPGTFSSSFGKSLVAEIMLNGINV